MSTEFCGDCGWVEAAGASAHPGPFDEDDEQIDFCPICGGFRVWVDDGMWICISSFCQLCNP